MIRAELRWNRDMAAWMNEKAGRARRAIENEVLRGCAAYVPFRTGALMRSGTTADGDGAGAGEVRWTAPYARAQYYGKYRVKGNRGPYWFERWKNAEGKALAERIGKGFA